MMMTTMITTVTITIKQHSSQDKYPFFIN